MSFKRIDIGKTPVHGGIHIVLGPRRAIRIAAHTENGASPHTLLTMTSKFGHPREFLPKGTLPRKIFSPNLGTRNVNAIVQRIHLGPTLVNGVNKFMDHGLVRHFLRFHVLLTNVNLGLNRETANARGFTRQELLEVRTTVGRRWPATGINHGLTDHTKETSTRSIALETLDKGIRWRTAQVGEFLQEKLNG